MLERVRKAQSTAEYAILIGLVVAAGLGVQNYVRRALEARIKQAADEFIEDTQLEGRQPLAYQWEGQQGIRRTTNQITERTLIEDYYEEGSDSEYLTIEERTSADFESQIVQ